LPGEPDNCIIAGHRDGPFRRLGAARPGDIVEIADRTGMTRYRIDSIETVPKEDLRPLAPSSAPVLTLVTCFPFNYVGRAPRRFIVRASLVVEEATERPPTPDKRDETRPG
jgi:sortase A